MIPLSAAVSLELAKPFVPYGPEMIESVLVFEDPPSKASEQPSLSESRSKRLGIPSPSVSNSLQKSITTISSIIKSLPDPVAIRFFNRISKVIFNPLYHKRVYFIQAPFGILVIVGPTFTPFNSTSI